jgi:hypothetical protein
MAIEASGWQRRMAGSATRTMCLAGRKMGLVPVLAWLVLVFPTTVQGQPNTLGVRVTGSILPSDVIHQVVGPDPTTDLNLAEWAAAACVRIVAAHQAAGYDYARAWFSLEEATLVWIHVDPGRMRVEFAGVGSVGAARWVGTISACFSTIGTGFTVRSSWKPRTA